MITAINRRRFTKLAGATLAGALAAKGGVLFAADAADPFAEALDHVDPELRDAARQLLESSAKQGGLSDSALAAIRAATPPAEPLLPEVATREIRIPSQGSLPSVTAYLVNEDAAGRRPAILHTHGGGFVLGSAKSELRFLQETAKALDCVILTVEYRLAPETRYTGSVDDNYAGLLWLYRNANSIGVDRDRIALMGESAGGGHAALLAIAARDRGEVPLVLQALIYPMLDDRTGSQVHVPPFIGAVLWTEASNRFGWKSFLGTEPGSSAVPIAGVPARTVHLEGLPPAFIAVGGVDLFVSEDIEYARRLNDAGVATELLVVPGAFHAFDRIVPNARLSRNFTSAKHEALRRAFAMEPIANP